MLIYKIFSLISYFFFFPIFLFSSFILILVSNIYLPWFYKLDKIFCRIIMSIFFIWPSIKGAFPKRGSYIIMMNHSSFLDVFIFPLIPIGHYTGITAASNFKIPIFSTLIKSIRAIPIVRKDLNSAIKSIEKAEQVLKDNIHIGILPEGTRTLNGKVGALKKGGFHMAINTKTSIIPVGISGAFSFKPKNRWWIKPVQIKVKIGDAISSDTYSELGLEGLKKLVEEKLKYLSGENS